MTERQLRSFIVAADCKSFSKAADESFLSSTALINQINLLERDVGTEIFVRNNHGIELTRNGWRFYETVSKMLQLYDDFVDTCKKNGQKYNINIAQLDKGNEKDYLRFTDFLLQYQMEHNEVHISLKNEEVSCVVKDLNNEQVQIVMTMELRNSLMEECQFFPIREDHFVFLIRKDHPLAESDEISLSSLKGVKIISKLNSMQKQSVFPALTEYDIEVKNTSEKIHYDDYINDIFANNIVMIPSLMVGDVPASIKVVQSYFPAGQYGFLTKKDPKEEVLQFIDEFSRNYKGISNLSVEKNKSF